MNSDLEVVSVLQSAKQKMIALSQAAATDGQWHRAQHLLHHASATDSIINGLSRDDDNCDSSLAFPLRSPKPGPGKLPFYYVDRNKLVKVGEKKSRDGSTYEHRTTREHFDLIIKQLSAFASRGKDFETTDLLSKCDVPKHEPGIILAVLRKQKLLSSPRRGQWEFVKASTFASDAQRVWAAIPRSRD